MSRRSKITYSFILAGLLVALSCLPVFAYEIFDLGAGVSPQDVNNSGVVVGLRTTANSQTTAFRYTTATGQMEALKGVAAYAVNDAGQVAGNTLVGAFLMNASGSMKTWNEKVAYGLNNMGQVSGAMAGINPYRPRPVPYNPAVYDGFQWSRISIAQVYPRGRRLGVYADIYQLADINDQGVAVGRKSRYGLSGSAGIMISPPYSISSFSNVTYLRDSTVSLGAASAINNSNMVVGTTNGSVQAYLYDGTSAKTLGTLAGGMYSGATDINEANTVVGFSGTANGDHAFVYKSGSVMEDLNDLVNAPQWVLVSAMAINDMGDIVGNGLLNGQPHGFLLTNGTVAPLPMPPSTVQPQVPSLPIPQPPIVAGPTTPPTNQPPVAIVKAKNTSGKMPLEVKFKGKKSYDPDGDAISYYWDFGDSTFSTRRNPTHVYRQVGTFTAMLTVTDTGNMSTQSTAVTIQAVPKPK